MRYWKVTENGHIVTIGTGGSGAGEITEGEYTAIRDVLFSMPTPPDGHGFRLREDLTWEAYELPHVEEDHDPELTDAEALAIIVGGGKNTVH